MSKASDIALLNSRLILVANELLDEYHKQQNTPPSVENQYQRHVHFGDFAAVAASIAMMTFATSYERMSDGIVNVVKDVAKKLPKL